MRLPQLPDYAIALGLVGLMTLLGKLLFEAGNVTDVGLLFLLPVLYAATRFGRAVGIAASIASALAYNFFFIPPVNTLHISDPRNILTILVLLAVALVSSQLAARVRDQALLAQQSAAENSSLAAFARRLTGVSKADDLAILLCGEVGKMFDVHTLLMLPDDGELVLRAAVPPAPRLETIEQAAAQSAFEHNKPAGRSTGTLSASEWLFHPIAVADHVVGVLGLARSDAGMPISVEQMPLFLALLDQAALAFERVSLEAEMATVTHLKERDRLRAALLSSVSHDLRTPLTTMLGSLGEMRAATPAQERQLTEARGEAERLNRFVANLLDMVRIETGALHQSIEPVDVGEAVAAAVHDMRHVLRANQVAVDISPDLPLVRLDPQLFHHCLINLIENASKYGRPAAPISILARRAPPGVTLAVLDEGPGLPPGEERRIFDTFARIEGSDRKGGTGLGLAIVKGFAEAMGIGVQAGNRQDGSGARFELLFPADKLVIGTAGE